MRGPIWKSREPVLGKSRKKVVSLLYSGLSSGGLVWREVVEGEGFMAKMVGK